MDAILEAIESKSENSSSVNSSQSSDMTHLNGSQSEVNGTEPVLFFDERPPQWCIVDKWFTMTVLCSDHNIQELEAIVYNSESEIVKDVEPEISEIKTIGNDDKSRSKRIIAPLYNVPKSDMYRAVFRMRFTNGSKGQWLHIGIHMASSNSTTRCLLKSPPIKVQTNRSKRPRDTKKPAPSVSSLSPSKVPSTGNFPGRNDRMMLIFGSNFYLWGKTPIIQLIPIKENSSSDLDGKGIIEIRPPQLIWWSENLLECQVPETCSQNTLVRVCNYDMVYGEGKVLKVMETPGRNVEDSRLLDLSKPLGNIIDYQQLTNEHLVLDFVPLSESYQSSTASPNDSDSLPPSSQSSQTNSSEELNFKVILYIRNDKKLILVNTLQSEQPHKITLDDLSLEIRLIDYKTKEILKEFQIENLEEDKGNASLSSTFFRNSDNLMIDSKISVDFSKMNQVDLVIQVSLKSIESDQYILDSSSLLPICVEKYVYQGDSLDGKRPSLTSVVEEPVHALVDVKKNYTSSSISPLLARSELASLSKSRGMTIEMKAAIQHIFVGLNCANSTVQLEKWQSILNASFNDLAKRREDFASPANSSTSNGKSNHKVLRKDEKTDVKQTMNNGNSNNQKESTHKPFPSPVSSHKNGTPLTNSSLATSHNNNNNNNNSNRASLSSSNSQSTPPSSQNSQTVDETDSDDDETVVDSSFGEEQDSKDKTIACPQNTPIANTFMSNVPPEKRPSVIYWKFFNPGTRTYLELSGGKLQIIGSRRIQMLVEGLPSPGCKFIGAHLYVHKMTNCPEPQIPLPSQLIATPLPANMDHKLVDRSKKQSHNYEMIENCLRCRENGIPNVFLRVA
eukprot:TRINITY_DN6208_c0_g4_i1.p1 TRINITY_DN6208_c0_g4~~TRINITY_DN6208_c0_g4_i1.p1  ORF type:complete len:845 (-),score=290.55 TRINITY_DN6208_c0_g4_i1:548-3082(-)